jgi:uncharacterized protein (TIGR03000 family)
MNRPSWKILVFGAVIVVALFAVVNQANAWCGGCGSPLYGPFPAYTAWDSCCGSDLYLGWLHGPIRRLVFGPYRWYGGWYGAYGCGYRTYGCCYPTYTVSPCCGGTVPSMGTISIQGTTVTHGQPTPATPTPAPKSIIDGPNVPVEPGMTPAAPAPGLPGTEPTAPGTPTTNVTPDNSGTLTVWVPYDAKVTINGMATKSTGSRRQFVSYDLKEGFSYKYEVKAEVVRDGKIVEDVKTVVLTANSNNSVAFGFNITPAEGLASAQ